MSQSGLHSPRGRSPYLGTARSPRRPQELGLEDVGQVGLRRSRPTTGGTRQRLDAGDHAVAEAAGLELADHSSDGGRTCVVADA